MPLHVTRLIVKSLLFVILLLFITSVIFRSNKIRLKLETHSKTYNSRQE